MVILNRVNVGGVNNFAAGPLYGFTILLRLPSEVPPNENNSYRYCKKSFGPFSVPFSVPF